HQEAAGPSCWIADSLARLRVDHLHHHPNDVSWRPELAVRPRGIEPAQEVLVEIPLDILVLAGNLHRIDRPAGLDEKARLVDLELGVLHLLSERTASASECSNERK